MNLKNFCKLNKWACIVILIFFINPVISVATYHIYGKPFELLDILLFEGSENGTLSRMHRSSELDYIAFNLLLLITIAGGSIWAERDKKRYGIGESETGKEGTTMRKGEAGTFSVKSGLGAPTSNFFKIHRYFFFFVTVSLVSFINIEKTSTMDDTVGRYVIPIINSPYYYLVLIASFTIFLFDISAVIKSKQNKK